MAKYLSLPKSLKEADVEFINDIITATEESFKGDLFGEINRPLTESYTTPDGKYHWDSNKDLLTYVMDLTGTSDMRSANRALYQTLTQVPEHEVPTMAGAPESPVEANTLTPDELAEWTKKQEVQSEKAKAAQVRQSKTVDTGIKRQKEIYAKTKINKPSLPEDQQKVAEEIVNQIKNAPTDEAINLVKEEIKTNIPEKIPEVAVELTAVSIVANVQTNFAPAAQMAAVKTITEKPEYSDLAALLSDQSKSLSELKELTQNVAGLAFGKGQEVLLPDIAIEEISNVPSTGFVPIQIPSSYGVTTETQETEVLTFGQTWVQQQLSKIGEGNIQGTNYNPKSLQSSFSAFKPLVGIAKDKAMASVKRLTTKAVGQVAVKTGLKGAFSKITATFGTAVGGPVGTFFGWLAGELATRIPWKKVVPVIMGVIGFAFFGPLVGVVLGLGTFGLINVGGAGFGATMGSIGAGIGAVAGAIGAATLGAIGIPILVTLLVFPVVVALILFIINSGAYIVPPAPSLVSTGTSIVSPYIEVIKTPNPLGPFENNELPLTVEYTISIRAKKGNLTNIKIDYECNVIKSGGSAICPETEPEVPSPGSEGLNYPQEISPASPYVFTYKQTYNALSYQDSLIIDTITVTADAVEQAGAVAAGSAGVKIGNPPDTCPSDSLWPLEGTHTITQTPGGGFSHQAVEAVDLSASMGTPVKATHSGIATVVYSSGVYGPLYIDIASNCGGKPFVSRYAHLSSTSIVSGKQVTMGQTIGTSGTAGTGAHLHYELRGLRMASPYIPKTNGETKELIRNCSSETGACGYMP
jgi:hypothetical protein